ncbi:hypothetical protein KSP40_PGU015457 [Platanthera guangdongensis]|uniref:Proteasome assembly chaperone 4 n=1 Tax=Platanthera guangdongensis TaxID=2320717 RepID=A0ABR2MQZ6_9ASPA
MENINLEGKLSWMHVNEESHMSGNNKDDAHATLNDVQITCFTEDLHDATLHFQIIRFSKQIYAWIGCNSAKFGHLYAAAPTRPNNSISVISLLGGNADNTGSSMARRLVLKMGLSVVLACNIPKDSPILEATAERKLIERLKILGYIRTGPSAPRLN